MLCQLFKCSLHLCRAKTTGEGAGWIGGVPGRSDVVQTWLCQPGGNTPCPSITDVTTCPADQLKASLQCPDSSCNAKAVRHQNKPHPPRISLVSCLLSFFLCFFGSGVLATNFPACGCNQYTAVYTQCRPLLHPRVIQAWRGLFLQQNVDGETVVFDVNSLQPQKVVFNAADCCAQCKKTSGCNTWTFCNSLDGCSSDCPSNVAT